MPKYKVGDVVRILRDTTSSSRSCKAIGTVATVQRVTSSTWANRENGSKYGNYWYKFEVNGSEFEAWENDIELVNSNYVDNNKQTIMQKVGIMFKKFTDKDTQTLYKAGYVNGNLELTEAGRTALLAVNFDANKAALVASAQEVIAEEEAEKKN